MVFFERGVFELRRSTFFIRLRRFPCGARSLRSTCTQVTVQKRLVLAAAALPVLQVPLHAFSLVVPHLVALLESFSPCAGEGDRGRRRDADGKSPAVGREQAPPASAGVSCEALEQEIGDANSMQQVGTGQPHDRLGANTTSLPKLPNGENQQPGLAEVAVEAGEGRQPDQSEASAEARSLDTAWVSVFDLSAARLGPSLAIEVLLPSVLGVLER